MATYETVKSRILELCEEKNLTLNKLSTESAVPPSTLKNILYGKSKNPGIVTIKMLCDGFGITLTEFFDTKKFKELEQEIKYANSCSTKPPFSQENGGFAVELQRIHTIICKKQLLCTH